MKELKDNPVLSGLAVSPFPAGARGEPALSALADQLSAIADALYKKGQATGSVGHTNTQRYTIPSRPIDPSGASTAPLKSSELKLQRAIYGEIAKEAYATRRRRSAIFENAELFGEPAWDILLDLYIAHVDDKPVSVSSACIGSAAPPTTGLRWLGLLTEQGLIVREHDPEDQRRVLVRLTDKSLQAMDEYFASAGLSV